jgi:hypothetical protein
MENDVFAIFYRTAPADNKEGTTELFIVIRDLPKYPSPPPSAILQWYAEKYGFDRALLSGGWVQTIDGQECPIYPGQSGGKS